MRLSSRSRWPSEIGASDAGHYSVHLDPNRTDLQTCKGSDDFEASTRLHRLDRSRRSAIHLAVPDAGDRLVLIDRVDSVHAVRTFNAIGASMALHTTSSGKAFLARLPEDEARQILARPLERATPNTVVEFDTLWAQIEQIRKQGYALNVAENRPDVCAIGAAIVNAAQRPVATIAISMPFSRYDPDRVPEWGNLVSGAAEEISHSL